MPAWAYALVVAECLPLLWRRRQPFAVGLVVGLLTAAHGLATVPEPAVPFAGLVGLFSVAAYASRRLSVLAAGIAAVTIVVTLVLDRAGANAQDYTVTLLVFATAWLLGDSVRLRRERAAELEDRIEQAERLREVEAERVLAEERARIARELHDVVAHAVSLMVVQAEAGPVVVARDPARAVGAFDTISATGKQALTEMRRLLGVLRTDQAGPLAPQPGLHRLDDLVVSFRDAGLPVELVVQGEPRPLPQGIDLSAYRILQEALTNVLKHAGPARAQVGVRYEPAAVVLTVEDDGLGAATSAPSGGNGLVGMRERAALLDGTVHAGPAGDGWRVEAHLPAPVLVAP
ncbi:MAG: Signal transduction histidine kinase [Frankiales bacterium]|nr:Signal transduction histidine kinase [Frankiales bacterium]